MTLPSSDTVVTHIHDLAELSHVTTSLTTQAIEGGLELTMETVSTPT